MFGRRFSWKNDHTNMVELQTRSEIFPATTGGAPQMCTELQVPLLGSLPLDPLLTRCCDDGRDFLQELPNSPAVLALTAILESE